MWRFISVPILFETDAPTFPSWALADTQPWSSWEGRQVGRGRRCGVCAFPPHPGSGSHLSTVPHEGRWRCVPGSEDVRVNTNVCL